MVFFTIEDVVNIVEFSKNKNIFYVLYCYLILLLILYLIII